MPFLLALAFIYLPGWVWPALIIFALIALLVPGLAPPRTGGK
jgi:hypothetical protein